MKKNDKDVADLSDLRMTAEEKLAGKELVIEKLSDDEVRTLAHELQVHQIELEMQNEELRRVQSEIEESRRKYADLYYFAPIGYITIDKSAIIHEANFKAATLLGVERSRLIKSSFNKNIKREDKDIFYLYLRWVLDREESKNCVIRLLGKDNVEFFAQLDGVLVNGMDGNPLCRVSITDFTERKQAEEDVKDSQKQLRKLTSHMQSVQENERASIARDIHDELGQILTALHFELSFISKSLPPDTKEFFDDKSKTVSVLVNKAIETVQRISSELHPRVLDDLGLVAAIEWYVREYQERTGIECKLIFDPKEINEDKDLDRAIYRAVQEALTNVARHANATRINICLCKRDKNLLLEIIDNGRGVTEDEISSINSFGLLGIKERFRPFGGMVEVKGIDGEGTTVLITIPVKED